MAVAHRVGAHERELRRPRLARLLPDADEHLEPGRVRRLPGPPRAAAQVVHRPRRSPCARSASPRATRPTARTRASGATGSPTSSAGGGVPRPLPDAPRPRPTACWRRPARPAARRRAPTRWRSPTRSGGAAAGGGSTVGVQALMIAEKFKGTPYVWGGDTPETGFDCSGLVQWSYKQMGIDLPRVADRADPGRRARPDRRPAEAGRHRLLPGLDRLHPPRGHLHRQRHVPPRPAHRRRGEGLEPRRALLRAAVRGRKRRERPRPRRPAPGRGRCRRFPRRGGAPGHAAPAAPATPTPAAADAGDSSDGGAADGLFGAIEQSQKGGSHSTVQILPAVQDPNDAARRLSLGR